MGLALTKLVVAEVGSGLYGRTLVTFVHMSKKAAIPLRSAAFSVRDVVRIGPASATDKPQGVVYRVTQTEITVAFDEYYADELAGTISLIKLPNEMYVLCLPLPYGNLLNLLC